MVSHIQSNIIEYQIDIGSNIFVLALLQNKFNNHKTLCTIKPLEKNTKGWWKRASFSFLTAISIKNHDLGCIKVEKPKFTFKLFRVGSMDKALIYVCSTHA